MEKLKKGDGGIQLLSGKIFKPLWPTPDSFTLEDIAHALSLECRFGNHVKVHYSVAQHCVIMSRWFRKRGMIAEARWALLHEGSEGLGLKDLPSPIKYLPELEAYRILCKNVDYAVFRKFGLLGKKPAIIKELDDRMKAAEAKVVCRRIPNWATEIDTFDIVVKPYKTWQTAKRYFIQEFTDLFPEYVETD